MSNSGGNLVDLGNPDYEVNVKRVETPEDRSSRIKREEEATHKRRVFWALFAVVIVVGVGSAMIAILNNDPQTQEWARTLASAVFAGLIGYFGGSVGKAPS